MANTALITGGNSGMGLETVKALHARDWQLIVTLRDLAKKDEVLSQLSKKGPAPVFIQMEMLDLDQVNRACDEIMALGLPIDACICNAGIMNAPYRITQNGWESHFQVNYLANTIIVQKLLPLILRSQYKILIQICSSSAEKAHSQNADELYASGKTEEAGYNALQNYRESKLGQLMLAVGADLMHGNDGLKSYAVHPGVVNTNLFYRNNGQWYRILMKPFVWAGYALGAFATPAQGAETAIWLAENNGDPGVRYWHKCKPRPMPAQAQDHAFASTLWTRSMKLMK